MRRFTIGALALAGALALGSAASAQPIVGSENFDAPLVTATTGAGPSNVALSTGTWVYVNNSPGGPGTTGVFNGTVFPAHSAPGQLNMNFNNSTGGNDISTYFMSPAGLMQAGDVISFWSRSISSTFPDRLRLRISTNGASTSPGDFGPPLVDINPTLTPGAAGYPNVWTLYSYTLTAGDLGGASATGRFAFHYDVPNGGPLGNNSDYIGIDSVGYAPIPEPAAFGLLAGAGLLALRRRRA
jgi:MYXO-CTERM domain-containing protein